MWWRRSGTYCSISREYFSFGAFVPPTLSFSQRNAISLHPPTATLQRQTARFPDPFNPPHSPTPTNHRRHAQSRHNHAQSSSARISSSGGAPPALPHQIPSPPSSHTPSPTPPALARTPSSSPHPCGPNTAPAEPPGLQSTSVEAGSGPKGARSVNAGRTGIDHFVIIAEL